MDSPVDNHDSERSRRVILLGASNLTRGISTVVQTARSVWGEPLEVVAALGHGRSYGMSSSVLGRRMPGILQSGLWDALAQAPPADTAALVTDIGNDLLFGAPVDQVAQWVEECLDRLGQLGATVVMTLPPVENVRELSVWRYLLFRTLFVPRCRISLETMSGRVRELHERLGTVAEQREVAIVEHRTDWYGADPIHIKLRHWPRAWREILSPWNKDAPGDLADPSLTRSSASLARWLYLRSLAPERRWICGIPQHRSQPAGNLPGGTSIALY